jgi:CheY-like chemotaxis protein
MRLLLVEDNATFAAEVERAVGDIHDCDDLVWARSRDAALEQLRVAPFDLVILDRKLPSRDDELDDHDDHGWAVFQFVRQHSAGTPVWFLTGTEDADFATDINNEYGRNADLHGRGVTEQMYRVFWKRRIVDCLRDIKSFSGERKVLERIAVIQPATLQLNAEESRILRMFARRHNGASTQVTSLNGGLSNSRVLKVFVNAADRRILATAAAKVSTLAETKAEEERYQNHILRLRPGGFPQLVATIEVGAGNTGGLFYGMVGDTVESLFDRIAVGDAGVPHIPPDLRAILHPWYQANHIEQVSVGQIWRRFIGDARLHEIRAELDSIDTTGIEARVISAAACCQHRDLHCANVVFDARGQAMLIDFGDTGLSYAAVDPVTLELSTVFHSQHSNLPGGWPTEVNMQEWPNLPRYLENCQFNTFITACRDWANAEAGSPDEIVAVAYAYAMRQLKYADTDKQLARSLIRGCIRYFT